MAAANASVDSQLHDLYEQAKAAREQSRLLAMQLQATHRQITKNWQLIRLSWDQTQQAQGRRLAARTDPDRLRYSAYARLQARLVSMPVIEQAKGIIMAQCGWPEDQAFDALRQTSQRQNVKLRDLAASIVTRAASSATAQQQAGPASTAAQSRDGRSPRANSRGPRDRHRASA